MHGHAISPHDNALELGVPKAEWGETVQSNRKFSDFISVYIPEINQHFNGDHGQWLSTWSPWTEFGRPTFQLGGVGEAYSDTGTLAVVKVNDFYLGVIVPSGIRWVEFEFRPYVFWSFIPQILYGLVGGGLLLRWILARRKRARTRAR